MFARSQKFFNYFPCILDRVSVLLSQKMGQQRSRPLYDTVIPEEQSSSGPTEEFTFESEKQAKKASNPGNNKEFVPLLDLNFSSKRGSQSSSSSVMSDDSLRDDTFRHMLEPLYEKAVGYYREKADQGDAFGAYYIGLAFENGFGSYAKDRKEAIKWYQKSSGGFVLAEHAVQRLSSGDDDSETKSVGVESRASLLLRAALQGHKQGVVRLRLLCNQEKAALTFLKTKRTQIERKLATETEESAIADLLSNLAFLTLFLEPGKENYDDVIELFTRAADLGNYDASYSVGKLYLNGVGKMLVPNEQVAIKYLTIAADHGHLMAQIELGKRFLTKSSGLVGNEKFEAKAYRYFKEAADQGSAEGWLNIAHQYLYGEVIETDLNKGIECLERAAVTVDYTDSGRSNSRALCILGRIYRYGMGDVSTDLAKAIGYFTESANRKFPNACLELGKLYVRGKGVVKDVPRARALLESVHVFSESQYQLGKLYDELGDAKAADQYYRQAMKGYSRDVAKHHDYTIGLYRIAKMHENGRGIPKDLVKAKAFYYRASTSAEKTYILWWKSYGEKALSRLTSISQANSKDVPANA